MFQVHQNSSHELSIVLEFAMNQVLILHEEVSVSVVSIIVVLYRPSLVLCFPLLAHAHCERYVPHTYVRTYVQAYKRTYAYSTMSRHSGAETKSMILSEVYIVT